MVIVGDLMKKKILLDIDDVICRPGYLILLNEFLNTDYKIEDFKTYYLDDVIEGEEEKIRLNEFYLKHNLYDYATILPNAYEVIKELNEKYDIYICSACVSIYLKEQSGRCYVDKFNYLIENFPFLEPEKFIFTNSKNIMKTDIQIDDRLSNLRNDIPIKLLFTSYHNKDISDDYLKEVGVIRVNNWLEVEKILLG